MESKELEYFWKDGEKLVLDSDGEIWFELIYRDESGIYISEDQLRAIVDAIDVVRKEEEKDSLTKKEVDSIIRQIKADQDSCQEVLNDSGDILCSGKISTWDEYKGKIAAYRYVLNLLTRGES